MTVMQHPKLRTMTNAATARIATAKTLCRTGPGSRRPIHWPTNKPATPPRTNSPVTSGEMARPAQRCEATPETLTNATTISEVPTAR